MICTASLFVSVAEAAEVPSLVTRDDVGFINLNETEPVVTDVAFLDIQVGDLPVERIEISLYGTVVPQTVDNFKGLIENGYKGSDIFRVIDSFSIQGGNVGCPTDGIPMSKIGRYGIAAGGREAFSPENFRINHDSVDGGVVSMMKDLTNKGKQDSRFFITTSPTASWADGKYSAFGRVSKGLSVVKGLQVLPTVPPANYPTTRVKIVNCGIMK
jgi:cyclophilin family peptidyl-prolyl cis-trans isomerase